jgi:hypothetical protein
MSRIRRTSITSSRAIGQTGLAGNDQLPSSKISPLSDPKIAGRVGQLAGDNGIAPGIESISDNNIADVRDLLAEENEKLADPSLPLSADERSFLLQVNQLVAEIMQLLTKLSDRDRKKIDHMKKEYDLYTNLTSGKTKDQGWATFGFSLGSFLVTAITIPFGETASKLGDALGRQLPGMGQAYTNSLQADATKYQSKNSLINTELQNMSTKGSDNSGWKNELIQSLNDIKEWMRASVRSNG